MNLHRLLKNPRVYEAKGNILSFGRRSVRRYLAANFALPVGSRVLDVGCGTGGHADGFSCAFYGVDMNAAYIRFASAHRPGAFSVMDGAYLGFPDQSFDLTFCVGLCHHLSDGEVRAAAAEMKRVTRRGGEVVIIDGVFPRKANVVGYALFKLDRGGHTRKLGALEALLGEEGFDVIEGNIEGSFPYRRAVFRHRR